jgi:phosphate transport system protein
MLTKYEEKLKNINEMMIAIGQKIVKANEVIYDGLKSGDYSKFKDAKESLTGIKDEARTVDKEIVITLALFAPEAKDLKTIISYLKMTNEYLRASSNTKSFLKNFPVKTDGELHFGAIMANIVLLQKASLAALKNAVSMLSQEDQETKEDLCVKANMEESKADDIYSLIEKDLFVEMLNAKELSQEYFQALSLIRKIEKIADRAACMASLQYDICHSN